MRILQSRSDSLTDPKTLTSGIGSRELFERRLRLANQNSSQGNVLQRNLSAVSPGLEKRTYQLTYCQKFPNLTTSRPHKYDRTGGHNYYYMYL